MQVVAEVPSFASVAERHLDDVHAYLVYLTRDRGVAEDLTAETFEKALRQWRRFDPRRGSARTWLCQLARTTALDHFRAEERRRRRERAPTRRRARARSRTASSAACRRSSSARSRRCPPGEREVIALRVLLDLDSETAARVLGISADQLHDAAEPRAEEARREDECRCRSLTTRRSSNQIRSAQIAASPELRGARARDRGRRRPAAPPRPRRELPWRRWTLVLVPAAVAVALAATLAVGLARLRGRSSGKDAAAESSAEAPPALRFTGPAAGRDRDDGRAASGGEARAGAGAGRQSPATPGRAQLYEAELTLKIKDLSAATKRALRLTRDFHGYVRSVDYGSGTERGSAYIVLRVPVGSVQEAIVKFSALGRILDQHVSIQDVQPTVDKRFRADAGAARPDREAPGEAREPDADRRASARRSRTSSSRTRRQLARPAEAADRAGRGRRATRPSSSTCAPGEKAVVVPHEPSRIGRALHRSGQILVDEAKVLVYVLIVGAPLFVLAALALRRAQAPAPPGRGAAAR